MNNQEQFANRSFFLFLTALVLLCAFVLREYMYAVFWAVVLSIVFYPLQTKLQAVAKPSIAATLNVLFIIFLVITPLLLISSLAIEQGVGLLQKITTPESQKELGELFNTAVGFLPTELSLFAAQNISLGEIGSSIGAWFLGFLQRVTVGTTGFVARSMIMVFCLFYFLKDGKRFIEKIIEWLPFGDSDERELLKRFTSTTQATLKGTFLIALVQGVLAAFVYVVIGLEAALFLAVLTMFAAIIPALGPNIILVPFLIVNLITGNWFGVVVLLNGLLVINTIDNFLRPVLLGRDTAMHPLIILLSTVGGISVFGLSGIIFGPILFSLLKATLDIYTRRMKEIFNT